MVKVVVNIEREPRHTHGVGYLGLSIRLALELDAANPQERGIARGFFRELEHAKFYLYFIRDNDTSNPAPVIYSLLNHPLDVNGGFKAATAQRFDEWLADAAGDLVSPGHTEGTLEAKSASADKRLILLSAGSWTAPIPQEIGLTWVGKTVIADIEANVYKLDRLLDDLEDQGGDMLVGAEKDLPGLILNEAEQLSADFTKNSQLVHNLDDLLKTSLKDLDRRLVVVPVIGEALGLGAAPPYSIQCRREGDLLTTDSDVAEFGAVADDGTTSPVGHRVKANLYADFSDDDTSLVDLDTGYLEVPGFETADFFALYRRITRRAGSVLWAAPASISLDWRSIENELHAIGWPFNKEELYRVLIWQAVSFLSTLLDPLWIALNLPLLVKGRKGALVEPLVEALFERFHDLEDGKRQAFAEAIAKAVRAMPIFQSSVNGETHLEASYAWVAVCLKYLGVDGSKLNKTSGPPNYSGQTGVLVPLLQTYLIYNRLDLQFGYLHDHMLENVLPELNTERRDLTQIPTIRDLLVAQLNTELSPLFRSIQSEGGVEGLIKTILGERDVTSAFDAQLAQDSEVSSLGAADVVLAAITAARGAFYDILDQGINGADAMRAAVGDAIFALLMPDDVAAYKDRLPEAIAENLRKSEYFARRLTKLGQTGGPLAAIVEQAPRLFDALTSHNDPVHQAAMPSMVASLANAAAELIGDAMVKFVPDSEPQPLPIQLALDLVTEDGGQDVDKAFAARFNGVGLIINRELGIGGDGDTELAHVNIASSSLKVKKTDKDDLAVHDLALLPMQPADMDGGRQLFLTYEGAPYALINDALAFPDGTEAVDVRQFYKPDYPYEDKSLTNPPALMYGAQFNVTAHVISKAGTLPIEARPDQSSGDPPWTARKTVQKVPKRFIDERYYSRTTAIGRTAFAPDTEATSRLGHPETVQPLSRDYPRLTVGAGEVIESAFVDVFRSRNGVGSISRPTGRGERFEIELRDMAIWGDAGLLRIELLVDPTVTMEALAAAPPASADGPRIGGWDVPVDPAQGLTDLKVVFENRYGDEYVTATLVFVETGYEWSLDVSGNWDYVWLRLSPILNNKGTRSTLLLADPDGGLRDGVEPGSGSKEPFLLIGDAGAGLWQDRFTKTFEKAVIFPRVGFVDFDRWVTNPLLAKEAGLDPNTTLVELRTAALQAYHAREIDQELATLVQSMPDLAVDALLVEVAPYDGLANSVHEMAKERGCTEVVWLPKLADAFAKSTVDEMDPAAWLASLAKQFQATLIVEVGPKFDIKLSASCKTRTVDTNDPRKITITVPVGYCARISLRPLVPKWHFSTQSAAPVIAAALEQHAEAEVLTLEPNASATFAPVNYSVFGGLTMSVEGLLGDLKGGTETWQLQRQKWTTTLADALEFRPAGRAREYGFELNGKKLEDARHWQWRQIGWMDVASQRWRFTGRPIYTSIEPTDCMGSTVAAVRLQASTLSGLRDFQDEIFAERDDLDADVENVKLQPMPSTTPLTRMKWELPSATMFRHRFTVRSRYAGAMLPSAVSTQSAWAVDRDRDPGEDWVSVAILADAEAIELSRPRLRAFVPSTTSVEDAELSPNSIPPILAFVEEQPLGHGGLAEVMNGEIVTGLVWDTKSTDRTNPQPSLHVVGLRAQAGPVPTNTLIPFDFQHSYGVRSEGPIGLSFSSANAAVPSFKNTLVVLHPELVSSGGPALVSPSEEMAFSFSLRRYLDPSWTIAPAVRTGGTPVALSGRAYWFTTDNPNGCAPKFGNASPVSVHGSTVEIESRYLDRYSAGLVKLATIDPARFHRIGFLHTPLGPGRADLSVYGIPNTVAGDPLDRRPVMVGSVQWVDPDNSGPIVPTLQNTDGRPTVASSPTSMYWTMSLRDAETVYARKQGNIDKLQIARLTPTQKAGRISFSDAQGPVRLESLLSLKREATEVMQHIALFAGRRVAGIGGASEELVQATVLHGDEALVPEDVDFVRVVHFETSSPATRWPPDNSINPRYRAAVFNRVAMADTLAGRSVTFVLEPIATTDVYRSDIRQIDVSLNGKGAQPIDLSIAPQQRKPIATITLRLLPAEGQVAVQIIYDGEKDIETFDVANPDLAALLEAPLIYLSVTGIQFHSVGAAAPNEMWWHGSLLVDQQPEPKVTAAPAPVPRDDRQAVNFDWFFTPPESDPTKAISLSGLEQLRQAQARIISVSRRIAVVKG